MAGTRWLSIPLVSLDSRGRADICGTPLALDRPPLCAECTAPAAIAVNAQRRHLRFYCARHSPVRCDRIDIPNDFVPAGGCDGSA